MTKWIDISQPLTNDMASFPGDTPFAFELTYTKQETGSVNVGQMTASLHTGTHADAPFHYDENGRTIDQLDLDRYIGKALVLDVRQSDPVTIEDLKEIKGMGVSRVLLNTSLPNNPKRFPDAMPALDPGIAPFLKEQGVNLLGVDIPSVDPADSKELETHHALYDNGINILENLMLDHVKPGIYELIALPLAIQGADGSPVRAVLRPISGKEGRP
ncbi:arylformamidase [Virgibacillus sediminis]|uniref:Kynurenine formamidase n=1 Tax=Virgibacillus sediminis TaxID=202260 RepID=A0ABV7A8Y1_9BACI